MAGTDPAALAADELVKQFADVRAVDRVSFSVGRGRIFGLLGRNGAGKTTTLRMLAGIFYPDSGTVRVFGQPWSPAARDRMAYLPEERGLYRKMRVGDMLGFFAEMKGIRGAQAGRAAARALERFGLGEQRDRRIEELSKGNQQKVQLAGVLVASPEILLLDEPMSGLDPVNVVLVREILSELSDSGRTIVLSTHMMAEAEKLCHEVCLIDRGRVVLAGTVAEVRQSRGQQAVHVEFDGEGLRFPALPGVERAEVHGRRAELRIRTGTDTNVLLAEIVKSVRVQRFEVASPSLEEVFVERVGREPSLAEGAS